MKFRIRVRMKQKATSYWLLAIGYWLRALNPSDFAIKEIYYNKFRIFYMSRSIIYEPATTTE